VFTPVQIAFPVPCFSTEPVSEMFPAKVTVAVAVPNFKAAAPKVILPEPVKSPIS